MRHYFGAYYHLARLELPKLPSFPSPLAAQDSGRYVLIKGARFEYLRPKTAIKKINVGSSGETLTLPYYFPVKKAASSRSACGQAKYGVRGSIYNF